DLKEELEALLQCRVEPGYHTFPDTNTLLQYEESFLSYIDGELDTHDRQTVEELVRQYPDKAAGLRRLQQTVSQPDLDIVFPDKAKLYKKERRVVWMPWLKAGIAAAILGAIALLLLPHTHQHPAALVKNIPVPVTPPTTTALYPEKDTVS